MEVAETLEEPRASASTMLPILTFVLSFDDLVTTPSVTMPIGSATEVCLGRGDRGSPAFEPPSRVHLPGPWVSGIHAVIRRRDSVFMLEDANSKNGTFLNGARIQQQQRLFDGDLIEVGHCLLCFRFVEESLVSPLLAAGGATAFGPTETHAPEVAALVRDIARIAPTDESVLILGETGAGKEIAAREIHDRSGRKGAYRTLDCGAIPESLFESVLFGHARGAFTGALESRVGEIVSADRGSLFLDEVANTSPAAQAKLLRVVETGQVTPVGAGRHQEVDVRWIAATNADLFDAAVPFREDLRNRFAGYTARLPPLRDRREDLGALSAHFLREMGAQKASISPDAGRLLFHCPFEGNLRELRSALRSAFKLAAPGPIEVRHLPGTMAREVKRSSRPEIGGADETRSWESGSTPSTTPALKRPDAASVEAALAMTHGNIVAAADRLGTHPRQLYRWMARFGIDRAKYRG